MNKMTKIEFNKLIGNNIRRIRKEHNMLVTEFAEIMDISEQMVRYIENGKRGTRLYNLYRISKLFDIDVSYFFRDNENNFFDLNINFIDKDHYIL